MRKIDHICYHVDLDELIGNYISLLHHQDIILVIHNPVYYTAYLREFGFIFDEAQGAFDQLRIIQLNKLEEAMYLLKVLDPIEGPVCSLWIHGNRITDNIEENIKWSP